MLRRSHSLTPPALLLALLTPLVLAGDAWAHRLDAQAFLLPGRKVQIESWFSNGDVAKGAHVAVFRSGGQLLTEGRLNDQGIFVFSLVDAEPLKVIVSAGAGHRKELSLAAQDLAGAKAADEMANPPLQTDGTSPSRAPLADRSPSVPVRDWLIGVGFLLALAAFLLSVRNARQLRMLKRAGGQSVEQGRRGKDT